MRMAPTGPVTHSANLGIEVGAQRIETGLGGMKVEGVFRAP